MKKYQHMIALLLVLSVLAVSASSAAMGSSGTVITAMLERGMSMTDIVISLEDEPDAQAFLAGLDTDALAFLHLRCERELQRRGETASESRSDEATFIVNTNTDKFHSLDCRHAESIKEKNRWEYTGAREDLIQFKYEPCKVCNP